MMDVFVSNKANRIRFRHKTGPLDFGRERGKSDTPRCILQDPYVSSDQLRVEELEPGRIHVQNLSKRVPVIFADGTQLAVGREADIALPARLTIGDTLVEINESMAMPSVTPASLRTIDKPVAPEEVAAVAAGSRAGVQDSLSPENLWRWFERVIAIQHLSPSPAALFEEAAKAVVALVQLDSGLVLRRETDTWKVMAHHCVCDGTPPEFSQTVLEMVVQQKQTFFQVRDLEGLTDSLAGVSALVASPILSPRHEEVIGVLYGTRHAAEGARTTEVRKIEAQLVQVLAAAVSAGLTLIDVEAESTRQRVKFEQFFTPELARALERDPDLLKGRECELTVMFADVRGFSHLSEGLTPLESTELIQDLMERLTKAIRKHSGVLVDYLGDGLLAMWNAPVDQPDHASLACRAALAMLAELPEVNKKWRERLRHELALGIGINTGRALVGNTGSSLKFKYGPLGNSVNMASRVEGATKSLGVPILITGSTHARLTGSFATRRLCRVRVKGIDEPVDMYQLHAEEADEQWVVDRDIYEHALGLYESGQWSDACRALSPVLVGRNGHWEIGVLSLIGRCIEALKSSSHPHLFDPVLELHEK